MTRIITAAALLMACVASFGKSLSVDRTVTVCTEGRSDLLVEIQRARMIASKVFEGIGVNLQWQRSLSGCPPQAIQIRLSQKTPKAFKRGALAFSRPYEGADIQVFYDRIAANFEPGMVTIVLAHVMVHEITHLVEGIDRHSDQGIMKANWDAGDFFYMRVDRLRFAAEDINLIYRGLARPAPSQVVMFEPDRTLVAER
jgi:hypothetical protein